MIQLTLIKITGYGPWTLTLGNDREHKLQMLQSSLYNSIQTFFSEKKCLAFPNRFDEIFVVTNGVNVQDHIEIQRKLVDKFSLGLSMSIGQGESPFEANLKADKARKSKIVLDGTADIFGQSLKYEKGLVKILHMDVDNSSRISDSKSPYEISSLILKLYSRMSEFFMSKNSLAFFMGGDNFMIVCSSIDMHDITKFMDQIKEEYGISFNCGIGTAETSREAASLATKSLDKIRDLRGSGKIQDRILEITC